MKVCIDAGHGGRDSGARAVNGRLEKDTNLAVALKVEARLKTLGLDVLMTRSSDVDVSLSERCQKANRWGADIFVSLHADAAAGPSARGHHAICSIHARPGEGGHKLARLLVDRVSEATGRAPFPRGDHGVWSRASEKVPGADYYAVIRETGMPSVILERGFLTNPEDAELLFDDGFLDRQAAGITRAVAEYFGIEESTQGAEQRTPIMGAPQASREQAREFLRQKAPDWVLMADLYWAIAPRYGVRPEVALAQACKETGFFRYGGLAQPDQNNFAGIGVTGTPNPNWQNEDEMRAALRGADPSRVRLEPGRHGCTFADRATGVEAHVQHLYAYACTDRLPDGVTLLDPRFSLVRRGSAPYVEYLGAADNPTGVGWAYPGRGYGRSIVEDYLAPLLATQAPAPAPAPDPSPGQPARRIVTILDAGGRRIADGWLEDGQTVVPVRALADAMGLVLEWDPGGPLVALRWPGAKQG